MVIGPVWSFSRHINCTVHNLTSQSTPTLDRNHTSNRHRWKSCPPRQRTCICLNTIKIPIKYYSLYEFAHLSVCLPVKTLYTVVSACRQDTILNSLYCIPAGLHIHFSTFTFLRPCATIIIYCIFIQRRTSYDHYQHLYDC